MSESRVSEKDRQAVIERAKGCCEYCRSQVRFSPDPFSVEHILPRAAGGGNEADNLALSCQGCNNMKYTHTQALDPITGDKVPLFHPRRHVWREHFTWSEDFTLLVGKTPTGRATIERLQLNREGVVNLRGALHFRGEHPPDDTEI
jgi:5-methylcytosine-specific restriction endonuclease McrA